MSESIHTYSLSSCNLETKITYNGTDYTSDFTIDSMPKNSTFTFYAKEGYSFNPSNPVTPTINNTDGIVSFYYRSTYSEKYASYEVSEDYKSITFTIDNGSFYHDFVTLSGGRMTPISGSTYLKATKEEVEPTKYKVTQNLTNITSDFSDTTVTEKTAITINFTVNKGYENPIYNVTMGELEQTVTDNTLVIESVTGDIVINATASIKTFTITTHLEGVNITNGEIPTTIEYGESVYAEIKPADGYEKIVTHYYVTVSDGNQHDLKLNSSGWLDFTPSITDDIEVYVVASKKASTFTYNETLTNCTSDFTSTTVTEGENYTIALTANSGYEFENSPTLTMGTTTLNFEVAEDKLTANITFTVSNNVEVVAIAGEIIKEYSYTETLMNCSSNITTTTIKGKQVITLTANAGYEFASYPNIKIGSVVSAFSVSEDKQVATYSPVVNYYGNVVVIASASKVVEKLSAFANIYNVTNDILNKLAKVRFVDDEGNTIDYGEYITQLYILPYALPEGIRGDSTSIIMGTLDSKVNATQLSTYKFDIEYGEIKIPTTYNNVYDYLNTDCILHLPFFGSVNLSSEYIVGCKLNITYHIELYAGTCTVEVTSNYNDTIVYTNTSTIITQIPFIQKLTNSIINQLSLAQQNLIDTPFVEVVRNTPYEPANKLFGKPVKIVDEIINYTGFIKVDNIQLHSSAMQNEIDEIESKLKQGVYIL